MPLDDAAYRQRDRAESFGAVAADYDRFRPEYPDELMDDLAALGARSVLDVGCGTGKAARMLSQRGLAVLGVEPDPLMAEVARAHGIEVEIGSFESWGAGGRRFDLIIAGQAWHWVDPSVGAPKAAGLLNDGGTLALFWNFAEVDPTVQRAVDPVYQRLAPELHQPFLASGARHRDRPYAQQLRRTGAFASIRTRTYRWRRTVAASEWIGMVATHSDHLLLGEQRLGHLRQELATALATAPNEVAMSGGTYTILAG